MIILKCVFTSWPISINLVCSWDTPNQNILEPSLKHLCYHFNNDDFLYHQNLFQFRWFKIKRIHSIFPILMLYFLTNLNEKDILVAHLDIRIV